MDEPVEVTLHIEWPRHPDWETEDRDVKLGEPFYLVGSEGKYTIFLQTRPIRTLV